MEKYIDADKLKEKIWQLSKVNKGLKPNRFTQGIAAGYGDVLSAIGSLEQEQEVVVTAKIFLDALSKTPYNNTPITDAQIIVKQLLLFFENPKEYNPDAILEQPEVELEKFTEKIKTFKARYKHPESIAINGAMAFMARMFYQYPNVARRWYEQLPKATMD